MFCFLGFHDWKYYKAVHGSEYNKRRGIYVKGETRKCYNCGKVQVKTPIRKNGKVSHRWLPYKL
jgi:hypothetical protein